MNQPVCEDKLDLLRNVAPDRHIGIASNMI